MRTDTYTSTSLNRRLALSTVDACLPSSGSQSGRPDRFTPAGVHIAGTDLRGDQDAAALLIRLQQLYGVRPLRHISCRPCIRVGWLALYETTTLDAEWYGNALQVWFPAEEAAHLINAIVARRASEPGRWLPSIPEIIAYACTTPAAQPQGRTEELLRSANLWQPKRPLRACQIMTTSDTRNIKPRNKI